MARPSFGRNALVFHHVTLTVPANSSDQPISTDIYSPAKRSKIMAKVKGGNTKPEIYVRSRLHAAGFRFRLHRKDLPGKPDIVLPRYRTVIFVHGCFWHQHPGCRKATLPKQNADFWKIKLGNNVVRDEKNIDQLQAIGWRVEVVWECDLARNVDALIQKLRSGA